MREALACDAASWAGAPGTCSVDRAGSAASRAIFHHIEKDHIRSYNIDVISYILQYDIISYN